MGHVQSSKHAIAVLLVLCLLVVGGFASAQATTHALHHSHHQKSTHSTVLCSWMCAAGQVLEGTAAPFLIEQVPVHISEHVSHSFLPPVALESATSRGPPHAATI